MEKLSIGEIADLAIMPKPIFMKSYKVGSNEYDLMLLNIGYETIIKHLRNCFLVASEQLEKLTPKSNAYKRHKMVVEMFRSRIIEIELKMNPKEN